MTTMNRCGRCQGFVPLQLSECPNCTAAGIRGRGTPGWLVVLGASATAVTLAACYGAPPDNYPPPSSGTGGASTDAGGTGGAHADAAGSDAANADMAKSDAGSCADAGDDAGMHADSGVDAACP
jgi:hypothetical protein